MATKGRVRGLDAALRDFLAAYQVGGVGLDGISTCIITLPVTDWGDYGWMEQGQVSLAAGESANETFFTVPDDERVWLQSILGNRVSGDNTWAGISVVFPEGYGSGTRSKSMLALSTPATEIQWPDLTGRQTTDNQLDVSPILLEPGATLVVSPGGVGVAVTPFRFYIAMRRTKLIRALAP